MRTAEAAAKQWAVEIMLRQNRALVAEQIAEAILQSRHTGGVSADPLQRARHEQARADAATARRVGRGHR
jgi:hypothetical protein